jgi:hypothetical protein
MTATWPDHEVTVWRVRPAGRGAAVCVVILWLGLDVGVTVGLGLGAGAVMIWAALVLVAVLAWRLAFVPYISVSSSCIVVQNPFRRVTVRYAEIGQVQGGYYGLVLRLKNGGAITAWAVQKSNAARWLRKRTRADEIAEAISSHIGR